MKAVLLTRYGGPSAVSLGEASKPVVGPRDVLVEVHAASVNPLDFKIRQGALRLIRRFRLPTVMGNDLAGTVVAKGSEVRRLKVGDKVFARVAKERLGALAEYAAVDESFCALKPQRLMMEEAAAVPLAALTAWQALHEELKILHGQKLLIPAGAGGVGTFAVQMARLAGVKVASTASGRGLDLVRSLGANLVVDYKNEVLKDRVEVLDAVFDTLGGKDLEQAFGLVRPGGAICSIAGIPEPQTARKMQAGMVLRSAFWLASRSLRTRARRAGVSYSYLFMRPDGEQLQHIGQLIDQGSLRVVVDQVFPFSEALEALAYVESGRAKGKVVIKIK